MLRASVKFNLFWMAPLIFAGCSLPSSQKNSSQDSAASFVVGKVSASFSSTENHPTFSLPVARTMSMTACLTDTLYSRTVKNHKFIIQGGAKDQSITTDADGCLNWQERIAFNGISDAAYVQMDRVLVADGYQTGSRKISLGVNPWESDVLYLKEKGVANLVTADKAMDLLQGKSVAKPVWISGISSVLTQGAFNANGAPYNIEIKAQPSYLQKNAAGDLKPVSFSQGKFSIKLSLVRILPSAAADNRSVVSQSENIAVNSLNQGVLSASATLTLDKECSQGKYELALDVTPVDGPAGLTALHGIYPLANCDSLSGAHTSNLKDSPNMAPDKISSFDLASYASAPAKPGLNIQANAPATGANEQGTQSPIQISTLSAVHTGYKIEKNGISQHHFNLNACLSKAANNSPIAGRSVSVTGVSGQVFNVKSTDNQGCFSVDDYAVVDYYAAECYQYAEVKVQIPDLAWNISIPVKFMPGGDSSIAFFDLKKSPQLQAAVNCPDTQAAQVADSFKLSKNGIDYDVDENFNLIWKKSVKLILPMKISRPSPESDAKARSVPLPAGNYIVRWAIVDPSVDLKLTAPEKIAGEKIITAGEQAFTVDAGSEIQGDLTIVLKNLKTLGNNNSIYFEVVPQAGATGGAATALAQNSVLTFSGKVALSDDTTAGGLSPLPGAHNIIPKIQNVFQAFQQADLQKQKNRANKETFAKENNLKLVNLSQNPFFDAVPLADSKAWLANGVLTPTVIKGICSFWLKNYLRGNPSNDSEYGAFAMPEPKWYDVQEGVPYIPASPAQVNQNWLTTCQNNMAKQPGQMFNIDYQYFTQGGSLRPTQAPQKAAHDLPPRSLTLSDSFSLSHSDAASDSWRHGWSVSASYNLGVSGGTGSGDTGSHGPLFVGGGAGVGGGYEVSHQQSDTVTSSTGDSISVSVGQALEIRTVEAVLYARDFEKCAVIRFNPNLLLTKDPDGFLDPHMPRAKLIQLIDAGFVICPGEKAGHAERFTERYYTIATPSQTSGTTDGQSATARSLFVYLRGRGSLSTFLSVLNRNYQIPAEFLPDYSQLQTRLQPIFMTDWLPFPGNIVYSH